MEKLEPLTCNISAISGTITKLKCASQSLPHTQLDIFFFNIKERSSFLTHAVLKFHLQVMNFITS